MRQQQQLQQQQLQQQLQNQSSTMISNSNNYNHHHHNQQQLVNGLPPTPKVKMGAGLVKIFDQCPLTIFCACSWINPETKDQLILFGTDVGIYSLNLKSYMIGESTLELVTYSNSLSLSLSQFKIYFLFTLQALCKKNNLVICYERYFNVNIIEIQWLI